MSDGIPCHVFCAGWAGLCATIVGSPMDVMKTRIMQAPKGMYSGFLDAFLSTLRKEGPKSFYKGFVPNACRISGWNIVMFLTLEQVRHYMH